MRSHRRSLYGVIVLGAFGASLCVLFLYSTEEAAQQRGVDGEHAFVRRVATASGWVGAAIGLAIALAEQPECDGWIHALSRLLQGTTPCIFFVYGVAWDGAQGGTLAAAILIIAGGLSYGLTYVASAYAIRWSEGYSLPSYIDFRDGRSHTGTNEADDGESGYAYERETINGDGGNEDWSDDYHRVGRSQFPRIAFDDVRTVRGLAPGLTLRVAALSQRGFYPEALNKPNQDAYIVRTALACNADAGGGADAGSSSKTADADVGVALFGVFDGHGEDGDLCARFVRDRLQRQMESMLAAKCAVSAAALGGGSASGSPDAQHHNGRVQGHSPPTVEARSPSPSLPQSSPPSSMAQPLPHSSMSSSVPVPLRSPPRVPQSPQSVELSVLSRPACVSPPELPGQSVEVARQRQLRKQEDIDSALRGSFDAINTQMHLTHALDDRRSGTTSIAVCVVGGTLCVANAGDSRAILAYIREEELDPKELKQLNGSTPSDRQEDSSAKAEDSTGRESAASREQSVRMRMLLTRPLSKDHTPFRSDECQRIKATGARVLSMAQLEGLEAVPSDNEADSSGDTGTCVWDHDSVNMGEEIDTKGDPPRVWHPKQDYPGTAFTRSIGDRVAEGLGVIAAPELLHRPLQPSDRFVILSSDGVFEFLTSQTVTDLAGDFDDPFDACRAVVHEAHRMWLLYEVRTDDITIVCIYLDFDDNFELRPRTDPTPTHVSATTSSGAQVGGRRFPTDLVDTRSPSPLWDVELARAEALSEQPRRRSYASARRRALRKLSQTPESSVPTLAAPLASQANGNNGERVPPPLSPTECINHAMPRPPSVTHGIGANSTTGGEGPTDLDQQGRFVCACDGNLLLRHLSSAERISLFQRCCKFRVCVAGQPLIKQGVTGKHFFIVDSGEYDVFVKGRQQQAFEHRTRSRARGRAALGSLVHSYSANAPSGRSSRFRPSFGELSLLLGAPRAATVICRSDGAVWTISRSHFLRAVASSDHDEVARLAAEQLRADAAARARHMHVDQEAEQNIDGTEWERRTSS